MLSSKGYKYSKKIEEALLKKLINIGDFSNNKLIIGIKRYNIITRKVKDNYSIFFSDEKKIRIHKLEGFLTIYASEGLKLFYEEFTISSSKLISTNNYSKKKKINDEVSYLLSEKLIPELRKLFLTNLETFLIQFNFSKNLQKIISVKDKALIFQQAFQSITLFL